MEDPHSWELETAWSSAGLPNLSMIGTWGLDTSLSQGLVSGIPGFHPLGAIRAHHPPRPTHVMKIKLSPDIANGPLGDETAPRCETQSYWLRNFIDRRLGLQTPLSCSPGWPGNAPKPLGDSVSSRKCESLEAPFLPASRARVRTIWIARTIL